MAYRNEILATVRFLPVSLLSPVRFSFKSIRSVLKSDQNEAVRLLAASRVAVDGTIICRDAVAGG